jgi:fibronectin type 3 domain-containing protein
LTATTSYSYHVQAVDTAGNVSSFSTTASATTQTLPTTPTNLTATATSTTQINLSWTASTSTLGIAHYNVQRCQGAGCTTFAALATPTGTTYSDTGLTASTSYSYHVQAVDTAGNVSSFSTTASATTQAAPPTTPTNLTATATSTTQINLSWNASTSSLGIAHYNVRRCQGAGCTTFAQLATPTGTTYSDTGLTATTSYSYQVQAVDTAGNVSSFSTTASATTQTPAPPTTPTSLTATAISTTQVNLSWTASTSTIGIARYNVQRCQGAGCTTFAALATPAGTTYSDTGLTATTSYSYQVQAVDTAGNVSSFSITATATTQTPQPPTAPTNLTASAASPSQINLTWTASTSNVGIAGYLVERCQGAGCATFAQIATPTATAYNDTGLATSTSYSYRIRATDTSSNLGPYSSVATASTPSVLTPSAPTGFTAVDGGPVPTVAAVQSYINSTALTVHTTAAFDSTGGDAIVMCVSSHNGVTMTPSDTYGNTWISMAGATNTTIGPDLRTQLWFVRNPIVGPGHIVTLTLSTAQSLVISVFVVKGSNSSSPIDAISSIGDDNGTQTNNVASPTIATAGLSDLLIGFAKVSSTSTFQSGAGFVPQPAASTIFLDAESGSAAPGNYSATFTITVGGPVTWQSAVAAVATGPNQTTLGWTASTETGGTIATYLVERCQGVGCANFSQIGATAATAYNDTGLTASTTYSYRVRAQDTASALGPYSSVASAATPPPIPTLPTALTANAVSISQIDLGWTASTDSVGVTGYLLERCQGTGCTNFAQVAAPSTTAYNDTGLTPTTAYCYRVRATNAAGGLSPYTDVASAPTQSAITGIIYVQGTSATPQTPQTIATVTFPAAQAAGDLNVVIVGWNDTSATVTSVTDKSGNVYTRAVGPTVGFGLSQSIYYGKNINAAAAGTNIVTVVFSPAAASPDIRIIEYSGLDRFTPLDATAGASGSSAAANSGSATMTNAADLIVGADMTGNYTAAPGTGFTMRMVTPFDGDGAEDETVDITGSYNATVTISPAGSWVMQMVAFRSAVTIVAPPTTPTNLTAVAAGASQINLSWTPSTSSVGIGGYNLLRCAGAGCTNFVQVAIPAGTTYSDTGLAANTTYNYEVQAVDVLGNVSGVSNVAGATT